jgi:hypothetical protein
MTNASGIHHPQGSITLRASFLLTKVIGRGVSKTDQPVEKLPAELLRECMGLTTCGFL